MINQQYSGDQILRDIPISTAREAFPQNCNQLSPTLGVFLQRMASKFTMSGLPFVATASKLRSELGQIASDPALKGDDVLEGHGEVRELS